MAKWLNNMNKKLKLTENQKNLRRKILNILHEGHSSHIGSCFTAVDIIDAIYKVKKKEDRFVLSYGHTAVALYAVLEKCEMIKNPSLKKFCVHPDMDLKNGIEVSSGSLGQGLPIALGMALSEKEHDVYCLISDGECTEGSIWEALRLALDLKAGNLKIILAANGYGAYDAIDIKKLEGRLRGFGFDLDIVNGHDTKKIEKALRKKPGRKPKIIFAVCSSEQLPFLKGVGAHYHVMCEEDYKLGMEQLKVRGKK